MVKTINANSVYDRPIRIGYEGENIVTAITFNLAMWIDEFGTGSAVLLVQRNGDKNAYPVPLTIEDGSATWEITSTDCAKQGRGAIQIVYTAGEQVKKSPIFTIVCSASIEGSDTAPDPYESWLATLTELTVTTEANAKRAEDAAERAEEAAEGGGGGTLRPATTERLGSIIVGEDLQITPLGVLSVIKANRAEQDNTHPITAAAVFTEIGNIDALLQTI